MSVRTSREGWRREGCVMMGRKCGREEERDVSCGRQEWREGGMEGELCGGREGET